mmetsp:Transcript_29970/g.63561  ORF Transcript_29970/g.63561 Transcript_29970/m.63561 type:complete len:114 (-) Transcript_29970:812-1153(-)
MYWLREGLKVCVAQVNIYSKEESNTSATVNQSGRIVIEGGGVGKVHNAAPLAALLPWIRLPSFHSSPRDGGIELRARTIVLLLIYGSITRTRVCRALPTKTINISFHIKHERW